MDAATAPDVAGDHHQDHQNPEHQSVLMWIHDVLDVVIDEAPGVRLASTEGPQRLLRRSQRAREADRHRSDSPQQSWKVGPHQVGPPPSEYGPDRDEDDEAEVEKHHGIGAGSVEHESL
jgi:hypothetical protein